MEEAELVLDDALAFLDDYEAAAAEWMVPLDEFAGLADAQEPGGGAQQAEQAARATRSARPRKAPRRAAPRPAVPGAATRNSNRARDERKYELIFLRRQAEELDAQLQQLRRHPSSERSSSTSCFLPTTTAREVRCDDGKTWKDTARRLCVERQETEKENIRLRLLVDRQLKAAKRLEKMVVRKRRKKETTTQDASRWCESVGVPASSTHVHEMSDHKRVQFMDILPNPVLFSSTEETFDMLFRGAERLREEVDVVFSANGLATMEKAYRSAKVEQDLTNGTVMEFVANKILASDMNAAHSAAWHHFGFSQRLMPYRTLSEYQDECKDLVFAGDAVAASYGLELFNGLLSAKFDEWRVVRRFVEADRVIIVLCTLAELTEYAGEATPLGIRVLERTYVVLRPCANPGKVNTSESTLMQTCYRTQPVMYKESPGLENTIAALTDFLFAYVAGTVSVNHQMIEKSLRSQSFGQVTR